MNQNKITRQDLIEALVKNIPTIDKDELQKCSTEHIQEIFNNYQLQCSENDL